MAEQQEALLTFDEFRQRVGASHARTRAAVQFLRLQTVRLSSDLRAVRYRPEWVDEVKRFLQQSQEQGEQR